VSAILGLAVAAALWWLLKAFGRADPTAIRRGMRRLPRLAGGVVAFGIGALLLLRGQLELALLAGGVGAWLVGWSAELPARLRGLIGKGESAAVAPGPAGSDGLVRAGPFAGRTLASLDGAELRAVRSFCLRHDRGEGLALVEAYLDRRTPGWREHAEPDPDPRRRADAQGGAMTEQEAYQVLGLEPGAGPEAVRAAHRTLMKKLHPDQGGSTYLARRVNEAKDVLLDRHR
jgi:hypothetical protein